MSFAPPQVVEGQPRINLPYGLFSVLTPRGSAQDPHWQNGIEWETLGCQPASGIGDPQCEPAETVGLPKNFATSGEVGEATPFTVYGSYVCTPVGHDTEYAQQRATEHLMAREEARVEQALWTGDLANTGFAPGATSLGTRPSVKRAVAALEGWLATNYGSLGVIHMTREAALLGVDDGVLVTKGSGLFTALGTPVVAGAGYDGSTPAGAAPAADTTNIYATPSLLGYRSEVFPGGTPPGALLDRANNDLYAVAERTYVIGWDPCGTAYATASL